MTLEIRPLEPVHMAEISALEQASFTDPWSEEMILEELSAKARRYIGVFFAGRLVGYAGLFFCLTTGEILNIATDKKMRRQGIGTHLLQELLRLARELALTEIFLEVRRSNAAAIALYERFGFVQIGIRKGYYEQPPEDALLYKLML